MNGNLSTSDVVLLDRLFTKTVGIEIEDTDEYINYTQSVLERESIEFERTVENVAIKEIAFKMQFDDLMKLVKSDLLRKFNSTHPEGYRDALAGSMHVHLDIDPDLNSGYSESGGVANKRLLSKLSDDVFYLNSFLKRDRHYRDAIQYRACVCKFDPDVGDELLCDHCDTHNNLSYVDRIKNSKVLNATINRARFDDKPITFEIRLNEVFPIWIPVFYLKRLGYTLGETSNMLLKYAYQTDVVTSVDSDVRKYVFLYASYIIHLYGDVNNTTLLKKIMSEKVTKAYIRRDKL